MVLSIYIYRRKDLGVSFPNRVIDYLRVVKLCGVLLWNVWINVLTARDLIAQPGPFRPKDLEAGKDPGCNTAFSPQGVETDDARGYFSRRLC